MSLLLRVLIFLPVLFLAVVVVTSQRHETAGATLRASIPVTGKWFLWSLALVAGMQVVEYLFID